MIALAPAPVRVSTPSIAVEGVVAWHALSPDDVLGRLESESGGLPDTEAARRLARWGPNALRSAPPASAWKILVAQLRSFVVLLLELVPLRAAGWMVVVPPAAVPALVGQALKGRRAHSNPVPPA